MIAALITSCVKDKEPEVWINPRYTTIQNSEVALSLNAETMVSAYPSETANIAFTVTKTGNGTTSVTLSGDTGESSLEYRTGERNGILHVNAGKEEGAVREFTVTISDGNAKASYKVIANNYKFLVKTENINVPNEEGESMAMDIQIDTDIPNCSYTLSISEPELYRLENNVLYVLKSNNSGKDITSYLNVTENSGKMTVKQVKLIQGTATEYYIKANNIPENSIESFGDGNEYSFSFSLDTNVPSDRLQIKVPEWAEYLVNGNNITISLEKNDTRSTRQGTVTVTDNKGKAQPFSFGITQDYMLYNAPGMVPFTDKNFKKAVLNIADTDNDGDISPEEASAIKTLNISGKEINNLEGLEYFNKIQELDCSNNNINKFCFDDIASYSNLKKINALNNDIRYEVNISGCYAGPTLEYHFDSNKIEKNKPKFYTSKDFSNNKTRIIQTNAKGKGIYLGIKVEAFLDKDYASGAAEEYINAQLDTLFKYEPFASMKEYFYIYVLQIVAKDTITEGIFNDDVYDVITRPDNTWGLQIHLNDIEAEKQGLWGTIDEPWRPRTWGSFPSSSTGIDLVQKRMQNIDNSIVHEMGHAIGCLADQYEEKDYKVYSDRPNATVIGNEENVPWKLFFEYEQYKDRVGIYPNNRGVYPSPTSIMRRSHDRYFDSPSRYGIFKNIIYASRYKQADKYGNYDFGITEEETWKLFLEYDVINNNLPY